MTTNELVVLEQEVNEMRQVDTAVWGMIDSIVSAAAGNSAIKRAELSKKALYAYESNLPLSTAFSGGLFSVNGRIEAEGVIIRGKIDLLPNYHYKIEKQDTDGAVISLYRKAAQDWPFKLYDPTVEIGGWVLLGQSSFTKEDAIKAELANKDNYRKYDTDMYLNRATSRMYKQLIPWLFASPTYVRGEVEGTDFEIIESEFKLQSLIDEYGYEAVLNANGGRVPSGNPDEVEKIEVELGLVLGGSDEE